MKKNLEGQVRQSSSLPVSLNLGYGEWYTIDFPLTDLFPFFFLLLKGELVHPGRTST